MSLFLSCFPNKPIPMMAQAALGVNYFLCHSYCESLYVTMATVMEGGREAEMTGTSPLKNRPLRTQPEVEILNIFRGNYGDLWNMEDALDVNTRLKHPEYKGWDMMNSSLSRDWDFSEFVAILWLFPTNKAFSIGVVHIDRFLCVLESTPNMSGKQPLAY